MRNFIGIVVSYLMNRMFCLMSDVNLKGEMMMTMMMMMMMM